MTKELTGVLATFLIASGLFSPVFADNSDSNSDSTSGSALSNKTNSSNTAASSAGLSSGKSIPRLESLPKITLGCFVGAIAGIPIAAVRKTKDEELDAVHYMCGKTKQKVILIPTGTIWLPLATATGIMESLVYGPFDSLKNYDKPFSKEQFSLGDKLP